MSLTLDEIKSMLSEGKLDIELERELVGNLIAFHPLLNRAVRELWKEHLDMDHLPFYLMGGVHFFSLEEVLTKAYSINKELDAN